MDGMKFRVGSVDYTVKEVDGLHDGGQVLLGWVVYHDNLILLDSSASEIRKQNTLVHELVHAMLYEAGIEDQDEDLVTRLAHVLHGVLRDNDFGFLRDVDDVEVYYKPEVSD